MFTYSIYVYPPPSSFHGSGGKPILQSFLRLYCGWCRAEFTLAVCSLKAGCAPPLEPFRQKIGEQVGSSAVEFGRLLKIHSYK